MRIPSQSVWEATTTEWLQHFEFVQDGMRQAKCSAFSMKVRFAFIDWGIFGVSHHSESPPLPYMRVLLSERSNSCVSIVTVVFP